MREMNNFTEEQKTCVPKFCISYCCELLLHHTFMEIMMLSSKDVEILAEKSSQFCDFFPS